MTRRFRFSAFAAAALGAVLGLAAWAPPARPQTPAAQEAPAPLKTRVLRGSQNEVVAQWQVKIAPDGSEMRHGRFMRWFANGKPALEAFYRDGQPVGLWTWWDADGNLLRSVEYEYGYPMPLRGERLREPTYAFTLLNGRKTAEGLLKGDKPHGRWEFWHLNGAPRAVGHYLTGVPDGRWVFYYPDGQIERECRYELGILNGEFREAWPNGQERRRGRVDQGLKVGHWRFWYRDGRLRAEGDFVGDRQDGEWRYWDDQGVLQRRIAYRQGQAVDDLAIPADERSRRQPSITTEDDLLPPPILVDEQGHLVRPSNP